MKKLLLLAFFGALFTTMTGYSQSTSATAMTVTDTVVNAGTEYATLKVTGGYVNVAIQAVVTKLSGTVAGTLTLQGSLDGTNYVQIDDSVWTNTNVTTNTIIWNVAPSKYLYYRIKAVGSGTMAATLKGYVLGRKEE